MEDQRELEFHNTVPLPLELLGKYRKKAVRQKDIILAMFREYLDRWFTPWEIERMYYVKSGGKHIFITSVRRSITDLTKENRLRKGGYSDQKEEAHGVNNNRWRYNCDYIAPITPKKSPVLTPEDCVWISRKTGRLP